MKSFTFGILSQKNIQPIGILAGVARNRLFNNTVHSPRNHVARNRPFKKTVDSPRNHMVAIASS